jgi:hypothetical protein
LIAATTTKTGLKALLTCPDASISLA